MVNNLDGFDIPTDLVHKLPSFFYDFHDLFSTCSDKSIVELSSFLEGFKEAYDTAQSVRYGDYIRSNSKGCFFKTIKPVLDHSQKMRKQEIPDFNVFKMLGIPKREVVATAMWKDLLDPKGIHEQGDLFLLPFLELLDDKLKCEIFSYSELPTDSWITSAEEFVRKVQVTEKDGRVDVYLKHLNDYSAIAIEYKIGAGDQERQVARYYDHLEAQKFKHFHVIYIHPTGDKPSKNSLGTLDEKKVVCMSIRYELVPMLKRILKRNNQIPKKLKYFIEDYIEVAA